MADYVTLIAISALVLNLIVTIVGGTWKLSQMQLAMVAAINKARDEFDQKVDRQAREFGETAHAIREKVSLEVSEIRERITQDALFARDTFMRRDSFLSIQAELKSSVSTLGEKIEARLERMEEKIDTKS